MFNVNQAFYFIFQERKATLKSYWRSTSDSENDERMTCERELEVETSISQRERESSVHLSWTVQSCPDIFSGAATDPTDLVKCITFNENKYCYC